MYRVKIYGAGSIGNHLAHASRSMNWEVHLCDVDPAALKRTEGQIYPARYEKWDQSIQLFNVKDVPMGIYDLIIIGTPPEYHLDLAIDALLEKPKAILIEKPLCTPDLSRAQEFYKKAENSGISVLVGYDHVVGQAVRQVEELARSKAFGLIETIDVEFREHWGGIFSAHPWLSGCQDTYLGYWRRGGGASGEHSHAVNLWQHLAHIVGAGRVVEVSALLDYVKEKGAEYDKICAMHLKTESGLVGRVVQDVITAPAKKWGRIQGREGYAEWHMGIKPGCDVVYHSQKNSEIREHTIKKTRPDDFILELKHLKDRIEENLMFSPISLERGLDTMLVVAAAHLSTQNHRSVRIDYSKGYTMDSLRLL